VTPKEEEREKREERKTPRLLFHALTGVEDLRVDCTELERMFGMEIMGLDEYLGRPRDELMKVLDGAAE
jgi:hypothetical protein